MAPDKQRSKAHLKVIEGDQGKLKRPARPPKSGEFFRSRHHKKMARVIKYSVIGLAGVVGVGAGAVVVDVVTDNMDEADKENASKQIDKRFKQMSKKFNFGKVTHPLSRFEDFYIKGWRNAAIGFSLTTCNTFVLSGPAAEQYFAAAEVLGPFWKSEKVPFEGMGTHYYKGGNITDFDDHAELNLEPSSEFDKPTPAPIRCAVSEGRALAD